VTTILTGQWGVGPAWADLPTTDPGSIATLIPSSVYAGALFNATLTQTFQTTSDGSILDTPVVSAAILQGTFSRAAAGGGSDNVLRVSLVPEAVPLPYSGAREPTARGEVHLQDFTLDLPAPALTEVLLSLTLSNAAVTAIRAYVTSRAQWQGRVAITLAAVGANRFRLNNHTGEALSLITTQNPFFTGLAGGPTGPRVRAVRDGRYGMATFSTELVEDGEQKGLWVRPEDYDPEVEDTTRYRQRPGEGSYDDQIP